MAEEWEGSTYLPRLSLATALSENSRTTTPKMIQAAFSQKGGYTFQAGGFFFFAGNVGPLLVSGGKIVVLSSERSKKIRKRRNPVFGLFLARFGSGSGSSPR